MIMSFKVAIITGYLNNPEFVKPLLQSLNNQSFKNFDCYVYASPTTAYYIDDAFLKALDFKCYQLKLSANEGFAGNNNYALKYAYDNGEYKYFALINDDAITDSNWLKELILTSELSGSIAAVGSKMVYYQRFVTLNGKTQTESTNSKRQIGVRFYDNKVSIIPRKMKYIVSDGQKESLA
jgi:GT2 family glycosyltransferase